MQTKINLRTNKTIKTLFKMGFNCKQIREHFNEVENHTLNNHINIFVTELRKIQLNK